jgi:Zn-dependent protease
VPISVDPSFFVIIAILGLGHGQTWQGLLIWVGVATGAILLHEIGHAVAFRAFGRRPSIMLYGFGGLTSAAGDRMTPARSFVVSLAGPFAGFALGAAVWWAGGKWGIPVHGSLWRIAYYDALFVTVGFGMLNLLPVLPLDGGNAMASVLRRFRGDDEDQTAHKVSVGVCVVGGLLCVYFHQYYLVLLVLMFGGQSWAHLRHQKEEPLFDRLRDGSTALLRGDAATGAAIAAEVLAGRPSAPLHDRASVLAAWSALAGGDAVAADRALDGRPDSPPGTKARGRRDLVCEGCVALALGRPGGETGGGGVDALEQIAAGLEGQEWAPPAVLVPQLARPGVLLGVLDRLSRGGAGGGPRLAGIDRLQRLTHVGGAFAVSAGVGQRRFELAPDGQVAFNVACSLARTGRLDEALVWLDRAAGHGWHDLAALDSDADLAPLRAHRGFALVRARMAEHSV